MAAPRYTTDLVDIDPGLAESVTGWTLINFSGGGGAAIGAGPDFAMQGTNCVDRQVSAQERGAIYTSAALPQVTGSDVHVFQWLFVGTPGITATLQNRGAFILVGSAAGDIVQYHVEGSDTYGASGRVGKCYPIRYISSSNTGAPPYRTLTGTPTAVPTVFGAGANVLGSAKGANIGFDANRYGTGAYIINGDASTPGTFDGFQAINDAVAARYGILTLAAGNYELQGKFVIGQVSSSGHAPTASYFSDSNKNIVIPDTPHSLTDFSKIVVDHSGSTCVWNSINITGLGTRNPGQLDIKTGSVTWTTCNFTNIGQTKLKSDVTANGCVWRGSDVIYASGSNLSNSSVLLSTLPSSSASVVWEGNIDPNTKLDNMTFSKGSLPRHAISFEADTPTSLTLVGHLYTNYSSSNHLSSSTVLVKRTSGTVTINVTDGDTPSYASLGATVVISAAVNTTLTGLKDNTEIRVYETGSIIEVAGIEDATDGTTDDRSFTFALAASTIVDIAIINVTYENERLETFKIPAAASSIPIQQRFDRNYSSGSV